MRSDVRAVALALALALILSTGPAGAFAFDGTGAAAPPEMFTLLFLTLGPFKLIGPFARASRGLERGEEVRLALLATALAFVALALAGTLGEAMLGRYGIPLPILAFSGGLVLCLSALNTVLHQGTEPPPVPPNEGARTPLVRLAMSPLAFPALVTPYGVAALVVFLAVSPESGDRLVIAGIVAAILALDLAVMLLTRWLLPILALVLPILGAVLGIVQVALGLQIMQMSARALLAS